MVECFCDDPTDDSRDEYTQCNRCGAWCHSECIGLPLDMISDMDYVICPTCIYEEEVDNVSCVCGTKCHRKTADMDFDGNWIECDICNKWCHRQCTEFADTCDDDIKFVCSRCEEDDESDCESKTKYVKRGNYKGRPSTTIRPSCPECKASNDSVKTLGGGTYGMYRYKCHECKHEWQAVPERYVPSDEDVSKPLD